MSNRTGPYSEGRRPHALDEAGVDPHALGLEMKRLQDIDEPCGVFSIKPFEAYTLVAALQGTSRNPTLSDWQRRVVLDFARQIQGELVKMARAVLGPDSLVERTTEMGFDPTYDVRETRQQRRARARAAGRSPGGPLP